MTLSRAALDYLAARGLDARSAAKRRLYMVAGKAAEAEFGVSRTLLAIPYFTPERKPLLNRHAPFARARILGGGRGFDLAPTKGMKFVQPPGTLNHPYLDPARGDWPAILGDAARLLVFTEGEVKAMCATDRGIACVALGGVWSWRTRINGRSVPLPEFDAFAWAGRPVELAFDSDAVDNPDVMAALHALAGELTRRGAAVVSVPLPAAANGGKQGLDDFLVEHGAGALAKLPREPVALVFDPGDPVPIARALVGAHYTAPDGTRTLQNSAGIFYEWRGPAYGAAEAEGLRKRLYDFLGDAAERRDDGLRPFRATKPRVDLVLDALRSAAYLPADRPAPCWLDGRTDPAPADLVPMANGLLHVPTRRLLPSDPSFFAVNALGFVYDPKAPAPENWCAFLADLWPNDAEAVSALQEFIGYLLTSDTRQQKMMMIVGPKRSGKGTIASVLTRLVGEANTVGPTLAALAMNFGLEPLIGKSLAIIGDARLGGRTDSHVVTERLLSITGEDTLTVDRKYSTAWTGRLATRFLLLTNELPKFTDASGALPSRLVVLMLEKSFYGREDLGLRDRLAGELPGILLWALDGLDRLRKRGHFVPPKSSETAMRELEDLASPVAAFVRECCVVGPERRVPAEDLYKTWKAWSITQGRSHSTTAATFGRDLRASCPGVEKIRSKAKGDRAYFYAGITLRPDVGPVELMRGEAAAPREQKF